MRKLLLAAAVAAVPALAAPLSQAAAPVPCSSIGGGKYNCQFYPAGNGTSTGGSPVQDSAGKTVGYLHKGTNYVYCQRGGSRVSSGAYYNSNWAYTDADNGATGWVNAVYASGGDNEGSFANVPNCGNTRGQPVGGRADGGAAPAPTPSPSPSPTPSPAPAPTTPAPAPAPPVTTPQPCGSTPGEGTMVTRWNPVIVCVLGMLGQPAGGDVVNAIDILIEKESSGNPRAINLYDSNAQAGHPSKGLIQTIPTTFAAHRSLVLPDDIYDPAANIYAGLNYGIDRYGSILDIPGIKAVLNGGGYVGYTSGQAKGLKNAGSCGSLRRSTTVIRLRAQGEGCRGARRTVSALNRLSAIRAVKGSGLNLTVKARGREFLCDVGTGIRGAARVASCQSGPRTYWWAVTVTKKKKR